MTLLKKTVAACAVALAGLAASAGHAAVIGSIPGGLNNDFLGRYFPANTKIEGWFGANVYLIGGATDIKVEYFGAEAGFMNTFTFQGLPNPCSFIHGAGAGGANGTFDNVVGALGVNNLGTCTLSNVASGLLDFSFLVNGAVPGPDNSVIGGNPNDLLGAAANYFVTFDNNYVLDTMVGDGTSSGGQSFFVFLDDGGATNDDNHDDMVLRISISNGTFQVPEPTSLALLGAALLGLGAARRRAAARK